MIINEIKEDDTIMQFTRQRFFNIIRKSERKRTLTSQQVIDRDNKFGGVHFKPLPIVLARGEGTHLWDIDGKRYLDFLAGFATVNQGHCHPRLVKVMRDQAGKLAHTSRAFYSEPHGELGEYLTKLFGWNRFLPMNTGLNCLYKLSYCLLISLFIYHEQSPSISFLY